MKITTHTSLVNFLLVLSALNIPAAQATTSQPTIAERLNRINDAIKQQEAQLPDMPSDIKDALIAGGWGNGGGGGFVNRGGGGGFVNRGGGGWADRGGFYNRGGGGFINR